MLSSVSGSVCSHESLPGDVTPTVPKRKSTPGELPPTVPRGKTSPEGISESQADTGIGQWLRYVCVIQCMYVCMYVCMFSCAYKHIYNLYVYLTIFVFISDSMYSLDSPRGELAPAVPRRKTLPKRISESEVDTDTG